MKEENHPRYDVVVIGGGPAGSTAAALLARAGWRCLLLEKEHVPRFAIGESLLPAGNAVLRESGAWERVRQAGFMPKLGAQFQTGDGLRRIRCDFAQAWAPMDATTFQVERARFDQLLLDHAREAGVEVRFPAEARAARETDQGWELEVASGGGSQTVNAAFVLDATGRSAWLTRQIGIPRVPLQVPVRAALYAHYQVATLPEGFGDPGDIIITRLEGGWSWFIPLEQHKVSVGVVLEGKDLRGKDGREAVLDRIIAASPALTRLLQGAQRQTAVQVTSDYSYASAVLGGRRFLLIGDAAAFLDPIFSSGVCLGLESARTAAQMLIRAGRNGALGQRQIARYTRLVRRRVAVMRQLVDMFYDPAGFAVFMAPNDRARLFSAVVTVVAGRTSLHWPLRWRLWTVTLLGRLNRHLPVAPRLDLAAASAAP